MNGCSLHHSCCISPIGFTSSVFGHLEELGVDGLVGLSQHRHQVTGLPHVVGREECVGCAGLLATGRAADAVDIVLGVVGIVIVDDKFDVFDICGICCIAAWCVMKRGRARTATTTGRSERETRHVSYSERLGDGC